VCTSLKSTGQDNLLEVFVSYYVPCHGRSLYIRCRGLSDYRFLKVHTLDIAPLRSETPPQKRKHWLKLRDLRCLSTSVDVDCGFYFDNSVPHDVTAVSALPPGPPFSWRDHPVTYKVTTHRRPSVLCSTTNVDHLNRCSGALAVVDLCSKYQQKLLALMSSGREAWPLQWLNATRAMFPYLQFTKWGVFPCQISQRRLRNVQETLLVDWLTA